MSQGHKLKSHALERQSAEAGMMEKAVAEHKSVQTALQKMAQPTQSLGGGLTYDGAAADAAGGRREADRGEFPTHALHYGRFIQPDPKAEFYSDWYSLEGNGGTGQGWGLKTMPPGLIEFAQRQKWKQDEFAKLSFARHLVDSRDPNSQEYAYQLVPQLRDMPEEAYEEMLGIQTALRIMLRDGKLHGKEDFELLYRILDEDFEIPLTPVWDETGQILGQSGVLAKHIAYLRTNGYQEGLFWRYSFGPDGHRNYVKGRGDSAESQAMKKLQDEIKVMLVQRLIPNLRNRPRAVAEEAIKDIRMRKSTYTKALFGDRVDGNAAWGKKAGETLPIWGAASGAW